jgi:hypothetical protein
MNKGWMIWIALVVVVAAITYIYTGFNLNFFNKTTLTTTSSSTSVPAGSTFVSTTISASLVNCSNIFIQGVKAYSTTNQTCQWYGGELGVWASAGSAGNATVTIVGENGNTYLQQGFNYNQTTFLSNLTMPAQNYTVTLAAGAETGTGSPAFLKFNLTTSPPEIVYPYIYNANFSNGQYTGWTISGSGFGTAPLNITYANDKGCYYGTPWTNYPGTFFATTYNCGVSVAPGNITSEQLRVPPKTPFLNFRIVSPEDNLIYVEILRVNGSAETPAVTAYFNTFNITLSANAPTTFANVSIPLTTLTNKVVRIKVVATTIQSQRYIAVGDFSLGSLPITQPGISTQINITR